MSTCDRSTGLVLGSLAILIFQPIADFIAHNYWQYSFSLIRCIFYFVTLMLLSVFLVTIGEKLLGKKYRVSLALMIGFAIMVFFNNYAIEPLLQKWMGDAYKVRYLIIPDILALVIAYAISKFKTLHYGLLATIFSSSLIGLITIKKDNEKPFQVSEYKDFSEVSLTPRTLKPNVYFIVPDAFDGPEHFNKRSNEKLTIHSDLTQRKFTVVANAYSNASATVLSLPQTHAMNYLFKEGEVASKQKLSALEKMYQNDSPVIREFRRRGYKFYRLADGLTSSCNGSEDKCIEKKIFSFIKMQDTVFCDRSLLARNVTHLLFREKGIYPELEMNEFVPLLPESTEGPFFAIGHFALPHPPFRFDKECNSMKGDSRFNPLHAWSGAQSKDERFALYQGQALCAQKLLLKLIDGIIAKDPNAIIIVQADHGLQTFQFTNISNMSSEDFQESFNILYAFYGPQSLTQSLANGFSPINSFRLLFAWLDDKKVALLPHRSFYGECEEGQGCIMHEWKADA